MRRPLIAAGAAVAMLSFAAPAVAQTSPTAQAAVSSALAQASSLPAPQDRAQADQDRARLQPAVNAAVASGGSAAARSLMQSGDPNVLAAVLTALPPTGGDVSSGPDPVASTARAHRRAHAVTCWGSPYDQWLYKEAGLVVAWVYTRINGWCGNGSSITWYGGATFSKWTWGNFCLGSEHTDFSWDVPWSWIHAGHWASLGVSYAFGCFTYAGGHAVVRIAANGYADTYDDYGV